MRWSKQDSGACALREAEDGRVGEPGYIQSMKPISGAVLSVTQEKVAHTRMPGRASQAMRISRAAAA
jgi:hypothetical protein